MNAKRLLLVVVTSAAMILIARADDHDLGPQPVSTPTQQNVQPADVQAVTGEQAEPVLEPGIAAIEATYYQQMQVLNEQIQSAASEEQRDLLQQQAQTLKVEWTLALAHRQLDLARERQDTQAETELLQAIDRITHPVSPETQAAPRDPEAGISVEGGAR